VLLLLLLLLLLYLLYLLVTCSRSWSVCSSICSSPPTPLFPLQVAGALSLGMNKGQFRDDLSASRARLTVPITGRRWYRPNPNASSLETPT
jgi:hypothetical protein